MFFSVNTILWTDAFGERDLPLLERLREWGADSVEIAASRFDDLPIRAIRREIERLGLGCTLSASPPSAEQSPIHPDPVARRRGAAFLREAVAVAAELGASALVGPLYAHVGWFTGGPPTPDQFGWACEAFGLIAPDLEAAGVDLAIEPMNRFESFLLPTAAEGVRLCEAVGHPRIGLLLDTAHMVVEEKDPIAAIRTAGPWLKHLQTSESDRGTPGTGTLIDWPALFQATQDIGYRGGCAIESFAWTDPAIVARTWGWRALASSPDALARDGLAFLRRTHGDVLRARSAGRAETPIQTKAPR